MKKEIADLWVAALRSGEFKQARGTLQDPETGGFCCLGVLCMLAPEGEQEYCDEEPGRLFGDNLSEQTPVRLWAGISDDNGGLQAHWELPEGMRCLTTLNDGAPATKHPDYPQTKAVRPHSFAEIADVIEREWESL